MSGWYYMKEGWIDDQEKGPATDATMLAMAFDGELKPKTKVRHQKHTNNQWAYLEQIPAAKTKFADGDAERKRVAAEARSANDIKKQEAAAERERQKKALVVERANQAEAAKRQETTLPSVVNPSPFRAPSTAVSGQLLTTGGSQHDARVPCPFCGEEISAVAVKCRHCNEFLDPRFRQQQTASAPQYAPPAPAQQITMVVNQQTNVGYGGGPRWSRVVAMLLSLIIPGLGQHYKGQPINGAVWFVLVIVGYVAFVIPGIVLHVCCVVGAGLGDQYR